MHTGSKSALGLCYEHKSDVDLHVHLDYLRLTFFDGTLESVFSFVMDSEKRFFTYVEVGAYNYDGYFILGNIRVYWTRDRPEQGIMLELSGRGLEEFESYLLEQDASLILCEWLKLVTDPDYLAANGIASRFNCSRLDLTIDEMVRESGNYDLHDLKWKRDNAPELIETKLRASKDIEQYWQGGSEGISMYFGSSQSPFYLRCYEKSKERAAKENLSFEEALDRYQVVNRFEMHLSGDYALSCLEELTRKGDVAHMPLTYCCQKLKLAIKLWMRQGKLRMNTVAPFTIFLVNFKKLK